MSRFWFLALVLALLTSCGSSVVGSCSAATCAGCCTKATSADPSKCLREPYNKDNATCGNGGVTCEDCTKHTDGGGTVCSNYLCQ